MHSMYNDDEAVSDFPTMGTDIPFENVSGSVKVVNSAVRQNRDAGTGRWKPRRPTLIRGLDKPGERERNNTVLRNVGPFDVDAVHYVAPDYSRGVPTERKSWDGYGAAHDLLNHSMTCPCRTTGGAVCNGNG